MALLSLVWIQAEDVRWKIQIILSLYNSRDNLKKVGYEMESYDLMIDIAAQHGCVDRTLKEQLYY